jgi:hypothetical protein
MAGNAAVSGEAFFVTDAKPVNNLLFFLEPLLPALTDKPEVPTLRVPVHHKLGPGLPDGNIFKPKILIWINNLRVLQWKILVYYMAIHII